MKIASPMYNCAWLLQRPSGLSVSPVMARRQTVTRKTPTSSSVQPVTGTEPERPVALFNGVSNEPNGAAAAAGAIEFSVTLIGPTVLPPPVIAIVTVPTCVADRVGENCVEIVRFAEPLPDVGDTTSHGELGVAVHETGPAPDCVMRTTCEPVCDVNAAPLLTALKI